MNKFNASKFEFTPKNIKSTIVIHIKLFKFSRICSVSRVVVVFLTLKCFISSFAYNFRFCLLSGSVSVKNKENKKKGADQCGDKVHPQVYNFT